MVHTPKANELCPHGLDPNICGYCWNKAIANMIDENTNLKQTIATQQARLEALEVALTTIRYCEPFLGTGDCLTASEIAAEALRQETALSIYPLATVVNNNMPGTQHIIELPPNVTLDVGCKYRLVFVEEPTK